jgi:hypothetical protein
MCAIFASTKQFVLHVTFDIELNVVFNALTLTSQAHIMTDDKKLIEQLGGPSKLAEILGYDKHGGVQRVQNWIARGIPPKVKLDRPDIFLKSRS